MYNIIYMSIVKLKDILKNNNQTGGANVKIFENTPPTLDMVSTTSDFKYIQLWFSETISSLNKSQWDGTAGPNKGIIKATVDGTNLFDLKFAGYGGNSSPSALLLFKMPFTAGNNAGILAKDPATDRPTEAEIASLQNLEVIINTSFNGDATKFKTVFDADNIDQVNNVYQPAPSRDKDTEEYREALKKHQFLSGQAGIVDMAKQDPNSTPPGTLELVNEAGGLIGASGMGILLEAEVSGSGISQANPAAIADLVGQTTTPLSPEEKAAKKRAQLKAALKKTFIEKPSTQRKFAVGDALWHDKVGYTDYLNMTDEGDKLQQKGRIFLDTGVEYQKFIDAVLPRLPSKPITPDGPNPTEEVKKKMAIIKSTDTELNGFIDKIIDIYGDDNRASRKYLIGLKFEIYKLQINGMRVLIKKYVDDADDLQGKIDLMLEKVAEKVRLMNEVLEMTARKKEDGGLTRPEVIEKMNELIASYQGADAYRYEEAVRTFQQEPSVLETAQSGGGVYQKQFSERLTQEQFQNDLLGFKNHVEEEYNEDYFSYYERLTNNVIDDLEMTGGRSLTVKEKIAKDYLIFVKLINAQYALLKSEVLVKILFLLNYKPVRNGVSEWDKKTDFKIDTQLGTKMVNICKNLFADITDIFKQEKDADNNIVDRMIFIQLSKKYQGNALSFMHQAELNTQLCKDALGMQIPFDTNASYSPDDNRNGKDLTAFYLSDSNGNPGTTSADQAGVYYFTPNLFKMLKKISPNLIMNEYQSENSILKRVITSTYLNFKKILSEYNMDTGILQPEFIKIINGKYNEILKNNKVVYTYIRIRTDKGSKNPRFDIRPTESQYITADQNLLEITERVIPTTLPDLNDSAATLEEYKKITNDEKPDLVAKKTNYYFGPFDGFYDNASSAELGLGIYNDVKEKMWRGDNFCIFGYGQSGSGKTTSLIYADYDGLKPDERDGMVIEMLKHPDITNNYYKVVLEMTNVYTTFPGDPRKGGKKRFFVAPMDLTLAEIAANSLDKLQTGGGESNPSMAYRKLVEENGNPFEYWTDEDGVQNIQSVNEMLNKREQFRQFGGAPKTTNKKVDISGYDAKLDEQAPDPTDPTKIKPYGYAVQNRLAFSQNRIVDNVKPYQRLEKPDFSQKHSSGTNFSAAEKKFIPRFRKEFKWDDQNGTWVSYDLPAGKTPAHADKLGGVISKNFELGREIEATTNNPQSSRSHVVLCLTVYVMDGSPIPGLTGINYPNKVNLKFDNEKKRDPRQKSVNIPENIPYFKLMVCDLAGAENKFKCSGDKNDIEKFYKIFVPHSDKDRKTRGKYASAPMYDLYRCRINKITNPANKNPDSSLRDITKRISGLVETYNNLLGPADDFKSGKPGFNLIDASTNTTAPPILDVRDFTGQTLTPAQNNYLKLGLHPVDDKYFQYSEGTLGPGKANPIDSIKDANLPKISKMQVQTGNPSTIEAPISDMSAIRIGDWWKSWATGQSNDTGKKYRKKILRRFIRDMSDTSGSTAAANIGDTKKFDVGFNCDVPAYVQLERLDLPDGTPGSTATTYDLGDVVGEDKENGIEAYRTVFSDLHNSHRFDYESDDWNKELDNFPRSFTEMKKLAPFWRALTKDQEFAADTPDPVTPSKDAKDTPPGTAVKQTEGKNVDDFNSWVTACLNYASIVGRIPIRAIREIGEKEQDPAAKQAILDTHQKALSACAVASVYASHQNNIMYGTKSGVVSKTYCAYPSFPERVNGNFLTTGLKAPAQNIKDTYYMYDYFGENFKDPTLDADELQDIHDKFKKKDPAEINESKANIEASYNGATVFDLKPDQGSVNQIEAFKQTPIPGWPNTAQAPSKIGYHPKFENDTKLSNLFLMKYSFLWTRYYEDLFKNKIRDNFLAAKPLVAQNKLAQKRIIEIVEDFPTLFVFLLLYQGGKGNSNANLSIPWNGLKRDKPDAVKGSTLKNWEGDEKINLVNDEHYLYYNRVCRDKGCLGFEYNIFITSANDSFDLLQQCSETMRMIVNAIYGYVAPEPYDLAKIPAWTQGKAPYAASGANTWGVGCEYGWDRQTSGSATNVFTPYSVPQQITYSGIAQKFADQRSKIWAHLILSRLYFNCNVRVDEGYFINTSLRDMATQIKDMIILVNDLKPSFVYWDTLYHPFCYNLNIGSDDVFDKPKPDGSVDSVIVDLIRRYADIGYLVLKYDPGEEFSVREQNMDVGNWNKSDPRYLLQGFKDYTQSLPQDKNWYQHPWYDSTPPYSSLTSAPNFAFIVFTVINTTLWSRGAAVNNPPTPPYMNLGPIKFYNSQGNLKKLVTAIVELIEDARRNYYYSKLPEIQPDVLFTDAINVKNVMKFYKKMLELFDANNASTLFGTLETTEQLQKLNMKYICYADPDKKRLLKDYEQDLDATTIDGTGDFNLSKKYNVKPNLDSFRIIGGKDYDVDYDV